MFDTKPIRILRVIARLNIGGPAIQAITLSEHFSGGVYRSLLVCGRVSPREGDMSYLASAKGIQPVLLSELGRDISPVHDLFSLKKLAELIRVFKPHIIHSHTAKAGTLGRLAGLLRNMRLSGPDKIRLVHTFHGHVFHSYFGGVKTRAFIQIERRLASFTDRIVVVSPLQKEDICGRYRIAGPEKVRTIPLGFDLSGFRYPEKGRDAFRRRYFPTISEEVTLVGIIGRLTAVKNHRMFLETAKLLKDEGKGRLFKFLIVGDGELKPPLMRLASELGLEGSVSFSGWQKDMSAVYNGLDVVALTSLNEGTPVTLIEAMAAGKPVVATDVGGVRDLLGAVDNRDPGEYKLAENGVLIPSGDGKVLGKALCFIRENRDVSKSVANRARQFVLSRFSQERMFKDHDRLYHELVRIS
jgi:glycosyltransferase involved in cell wall biosynthesis